jgi:hypothetical protein
MKCKYCQEEFDFTKCNDCSLMGEGEEQFCKICHLHHIYRSRDYMGYSRSSPPNVEYYDGSWDNAVKIYEGGD